MRGEIREGRFDINYERGSIISGTSTEMVHTIGTEVQWWIFDPVATHVDPIYDVGSSDPATGGRRWKGPLIVPTINAFISQGATVQNDRGFYNTDTLHLTINVDVVEDQLSLLGSSLATIPQLSTVEINPDEFLRDRVVFRDEVFTPVRVFPKGIIKDHYTVLSIELNQVNPDELVNDPQFQNYAGYSPFDPTTL
jgi:hypothetical protein